jgi:hypothetical protein
MPLAESLKIASISQHANFLLSLFGNAVQMWNGIGNWDRMLEDLGLRTWDLGFRAWDLGIVREYLRTSINDF